MDFNHRFGGRAFLIIGLLVVSLAAVVPNGASAKQLHLLCGAGLRQPVDELTKDFKEKTGITVDTEYSGSGKLMARLKATGIGDVYIPGSHFYVDKLKKEGEILSSHPVVLHTPVVAVWKKTKKTIEKFADLAAPGVRVGLGDPQAMALGRTAEDILRSSGIGEKILPNVVVRGATVKQLALYVTRGDVDAGIVGRADAVQSRDSVRIIEIDKGWYKPEIITAAVLKTSRNPEDARKLAVFLSSPSAVKVFGKYGFLPLDTSR